MTIFLIAVMGALGVLSRYLIDQIFVEAYSSFPLSTFLINIVGSFFIGVMYVLSADKTFLNESFRVAMMVGFLGGFTTFSAYSLQTLLLIENKQWFTAVSYFGLSPLLGISAAYLGLVVTRHYF